MSHLDEFLTISNGANSFKSIGNIWQRAVSKVTNKAQSIIFDNTRRVSINLLNPNSIDYRLARGEQHLSYEAIPQQQGVVYTISCSAKTGSNKDIYVQNRNGISDTGGNYITVTNDNPLTIIGQSGYYIFVYASTSEASKDTFLQAQAKLIAYPAVFTPTKVMPNLKAYGGTVEEQGFFKDYALLEYIESSGTQYIDTGITAKNGFKFVASIYESNKNVSWQTLVGAHEAEAPHKRNFVGISNTPTSVPARTANALAIGIGNGERTSNDVLETKRWYSIETCNEFNNKYLKVDSILVTNYYDSGTSEAYSERSLYLFANHNQSTDTPGTPFTGRIGSAKIYIASELVLDYIPVKRLSDNAIGMYDLVEGKFYGNSGTGTFTAGPEIKPVEYIESSGTQYIDTGIVPSGDNWEISVKYMNHTTTGTNKTPFGTQNNQPILTIYDTSFYCCGSMDMTTNRIKSFSFEANVLYDINFKGNNNTVSGSINGSAITPYTANTNFTQLTNSFYLCKNNNPTASNQVFNGKLYKFRYAKNGVDVCDYIPVLCGTEYCMYDLIEHKVYRNAGTGAFTGGSEVPWRLLYPYDLISNKGKIEFEYEDGAIIPNEYDRVEYIESSGTQYIDTGITCKDALSLLCKFQLTSSPDRNRIFGGRTGTSSYGNIEFITYNGQYYIMFGNQPEHIIDSPTTDTSVHTVDFKNGEQKLDNSIIATESRTFSNNTPIYLFGIYNSGSAVIGTLKVFSFVVRDGNDLVRNFIPVKRKSDNVYGMYDTVTQQFFGNSGTGTFTGGAVIPRTIRANGEHKVLIDNVEVAEITEILPSITSYVDVQQGKLYKDWRFRVLDGTEDWKSLTREGVETYYLSGNNDMSDYDKSYSEPGICNYFKGVRSLPLTVKDGEVYWNSNGNVFFVNIAESADLTTWKAYVKRLYDKGTPVIIIYPLATPTTEDITINPVALTTKGEKTITAEAEIVCPVEATYLGM